MDSEWSSFHALLLHLPLVSREIWSKLMTKVAKSGLMVDLFPDSQTNFMAKLQALVHNSLATSNNPLGLHHASGPTWGW